VKLSAYVRRNWLMTRRNLFTLFEISFWPCISLISVGLLTRFLELRGEMVAFVLVGTISLSVMQVCQLDIAYAILFDMWSKSVKHQFMAPITPVHLVVGAWLMGVIRGTLAFGIMAGLSAPFFGFDFLAPGPVALALFLAGLFLNAALVGTLVCFLILSFGPRAEVIAWSVVGIVLMLCGIYYPVSVLPGPVMALAGIIPVTHFLEYFRAFYGFAPVFPRPLATGLALSALYLVGGLLVLQLTLRRARRTGVLLRLSE
jgi:ABC-2 type transport system permease protein